MNLEDHAGDIVRKARAMSGVSPSAAARAAGITEAQLSVFEDNGEVTGAPDFARLGAAIGVNGAKLQNVALGWLPIRRDLSAWRELRMITTDEGMAVNCYLVWDSASRQAALFDTGWSARPLREIISSQKLELRHIFITHSHGDHIACLGELQKLFPKALLHSGGSYGSRVTGAINVGALQVTGRETPGHAADGITYVISNWPGGAPQVAMVGDAIFAGSIGKGNISWDLARQKVREEILSLPSDTLICPGHGPVTTMAEEVANNPFF